MNAAINARLSNRTVVAGAQSFMAIFEAGGEPVLNDLVSSTEPRLTAVPAAAAQQLVRGQEVAIVHPVTGDVHTCALARDPEPDGGGMLTLYLREGPVSP